MPDDPTEALDRASRVFERVVAYTPVGAPVHRPRGESQLPTTVDPARRAGLASIELQAQVGQLATGSRLHVSVTVHHATILRWVVPATACATVLALAAFAAAAFAASAVYLGGAP